jgi:hypothetical protein
MEWRLVVQAGDRPHAVGAMDRREDGLSIGQLLALQRTAGRRSHLQVV